MGFDSVLAVGLGDRQLTNPMVNAGAIATASLVPGDTPDGRFAFLREGLSRFAGRPLAVDETVYRSEAATNRRNRGIAMLLAILCIAGQYQRSGDWLFDIGLPGKSGVAGGVITIAPGKGGLGVWSPPLDAAGTSVRGKAVTRYLSDALGLNLFASEPARTG